MNARQAMTTTAGLLMAALLAQGCGGSSGGGGGALGVDATAITGTKTLSAGSTAGSDGFGTSFSSGTAALQPDGSFSLTATGTTNDPDLTNPVTIDYTGALTGGTGVGPFDGSFSGTGREAGGGSVSHQGTIRVTVDAAGTLTVTIDGSSSGGNTFTGSFTFSGGAPVDLTASLALPNGTTYAAGASVAFVASVSNTGGVASQTVRVGIYLSTDATIDAQDTRVASPTVSVAGGADQQVSGSFTLPGGLSGPVFVGVLVDDQQEQGEASEANNTDAVQVTVN